MNYKYYIMKDKEVIATDNLYDWAAFLEHEDRKVARTEVTKDITVSTVFLGIDHNFAKNGPPIVFETMVFGGKLDGRMERCATYLEAENMHTWMVQEVKQAEGIE